MELSALALGIRAQAGGAYTAQDLAHSRCLPNAGPSIGR